MHHSDDERVMDVFKRWLNNAKNLPNARRFPKSWQGLINLLEEAELGEIATNLHAALTSERSNVRGNLL